MKKTILIAMMAAMTLGVSAGDWGKAPIGKAPIEECVDIGGEISVGYMTDYYFHGFQFAEDSVWADVNYTFDGLFVPVTVGAWYLNGIHSNIFGPVFDQLSLYAIADLGTIAGFDVNLGYTHHWGPEIGLINFGEFSLDVRRSFGFVDFVGETNYMTDGLGWYHQAGLEKTIGLTDKMSLVLACGVGFVDSFIYPQTGFNHYYLSASFPIRLNCRATLTPYVGYFGNIDDAIGTQIGGPPGLFDDNLHGGVSLSVTF